MRISINDELDEGRARKHAAHASEALLERMREHHDYTVPEPIVTRKIIIEIREACSLHEKVDICILPVPVPTLTVEAIKRVVCLHYGVSHTDMISPIRARKVQQPRMIAMYLAHELTTHGFPALGRFFHRDHTSVMHSVNKMRGLVKSGHPLASHVLNLREMLLA